MVKKNDFSGKSKKQDSTGKDQKKIRLRRSSLVHLQERRLCSGAKGRNKTAGYYKASNRTPPKPSYGSKNMHVSKTKKIPPDGGIFFPPEENPKSKDLEKKNSKKPTKRPRKKKIPKNLPKDLQKKKTPKKLPKDLQKKD